MKKLFISLVFVVLFATGAHASTILPNTAATFLDALLVEDAKTLEKLLHPNYVHITISGEVISKAGLLEYVRTGKIRFTSLDSSNVITYKFGRVTIITARFLMEGDLLKGKYKGVLQTSMGLQLTDKGEQVIFFQSTAIKD